jgi:hypothetical protein
MTERPKPPLWKFWPVPICAVIIAYELYESQAQSRDIDPFLIVVPAAVALFVIIVRGFMRVR